MKIGIIGGGVVGQATARTYLEHVDEVRVFDRIKERRTHDYPDVLQCDIVFICLPETEVEPFISEYLPYLDSAYAGGNYVIRSTVPVGTTRRLASRYNLPNLVHSPEFLTARCAFTDAQIPSRNIIGNPYPPSSGLWSSSNRAARALNILYHRRFPGVPIHFMSSDESEAVKLVLNGFFSTKVAYLNEVNHMVSRLGLDWNRVMVGVLSDGRVAHAHTKVPGPDGKYGFGGGCLPKDLLHLIDCIEEAGVSAPVCRAVHERNKLDRERK